MIDARPPSTDCGLDTAADPQNCGQCGHDCLGGGCLKAKCEPVTIMSGLNAPFGITSTSAGVYFAESATSGTVYLWDPSTGGDASVVATKQDQVTSLAAS